MDRLHQLEIKRLLKELDYVKSDFEYKNEIVFEADNSFMRSLNRFLDINQELKEIFDNKINRRIEEMVRNKHADAIAAEEAEEESAAAISENPADEKIKKIYRNIAKKTHPDKVEDSWLNGIYIIAGKMYESNDMMGIYSICDQLGIPYELSHEDGDALRRQISQMKERIGFIESTFTWNWYHAEDESERSRILVEYIKSKII